VEHFSHRRLLVKIVEVIVAGDEDEARAAAKVTMNLNLAPLETLKKGVCEGLKVALKKYNANQLSFSGLLASADATSAAINVIRHRMGKEAPYVGTCVIGTVEGDDCCHDMGKDLVATMLEAGGFKVVNLGICVPASKFVKATIKYNADIVASSSSAISEDTTMRQKEIEEALEAAGIRHKVKTLVGGMYTDEKWAREIGADAWGADCLDGLKKANELMKKLGEERKSLA